jgi:hypothetical protein
MVECNIFIYIFIINIFQISLVVSIVNTKCFCKQKCMGMKYIIILFILSERNF